MKKILALITFMLLLTYSCSDQIISITGESEEVQKLDKDALSLDSSNIEILKPVCGTKDVTLWLFDHYEPKVGKIVGIWPHASRLQNSTEISKLKTIFGFNYILLPNANGLSTLNLIISAGFPRANILAQIKPENYIDKINSFQNIYGYYVDEPDYWGFSLGTIINISDFVHTQTTSKFVIGDFKRTLNFTTMVYYADYVMFTAYIHWWECIPGIAWCSWPINTDQRDDWSDMKNRYGIKSSSNWIAAHLDLSEYPLLLGHSQNLNLPGVWLYQQQEIYNSDNNIYSFCDRAWVSGYLRKFERKYVYEYRCSYPDPCDCDPTLSDGWYVYKIWTFNDTREVFY